MPEEQPLQTLTPLKLVVKPERVVLVVFFEQVQKLGGGFDDGEGRGLGAVEERGDAAVGVEAEEPFCSSSVYCIIVCFACGGGGVGAFKAQRLG